MTYTLEKFDGGMHFIRLDTAVAEALLSQNQKRVVCTLNGSATMQCAIMRQAALGYYVNVGPAICKQLGLRPGSTLTATFAPDESEYQFPMPEELEEVLRTDPQALAVFRRLKPGNQRSIMYLVLQVKSTDRRIERALKIAENLKRGTTSPREILR